MAEGEGRKEAGEGGGGRRGSWKAGFGEAGAVDGPEGFQAGHRVRCLLLNAQNELLSTDPLPHPK